MPDNEYNITAHIIIENGQLNVLKWLFSKNIIADIGIDSANIAAKNGYIYILDWLAEPPRNILPDVDGANYGVKYFNVLRWLAMKEYFS